MPCLAAYGISTPRLKKDAAVWQHTVVTHAANACLPNWQLAIQQPCRDGKFCCMLFHDAAFAIAGMSINLCLRNDVKLLAALKHAFAGTRPVCCNAGQ